MNIPDLPYTCGYCGKKHFSEDWNRYGVCSEECDARACDEIDANQQGDND